MLSLLNAVDNNATQSNDIKSGVGDTLVDLDNSSPDTEASMNNKVGKKTKPIIRLHDFSGNIFAQPNVIEAGKVEEEMLEGAVGPADLDLNLVDYEKEPTFETENFTEMVTADSEMTTYGTTISDLMVENGNLLTSNQNLSDQFSNLSAQNDGNLSSVLTADFLKKLQFLPSNLTDLIYYPDRPFSQKWINDVYNVVINNHYTVPAWYLSLVFVSVIFVYSLSLWIIFYRYIPRVYEDKFDEVEENLRNEDGRGRNLRAVLGLTSPRFE